MIDATSAAATQATSLYTTTAPAAEAKKEMDQEVFLALLVAQLRNQDPTSPMDTNEMMAQSTQLASMEQLTALSETSREAFSLQMRIAASGLVGQEVSFTDADGVARTGTASSVSFAGPVPVVTVGEWTAPLDAVTTVRAAAAAASPAAASATPSGAATSGSGSSTSSSTSGSGSSSSSAA